MQALKWITAAFLLLVINTAIACPKPECVRIGAWNIEWLGSDKRSQPVDAATINEMAHLIADVWSIDVMSLEEINTELEGEVRGERYSLQPWQQLQAALQKRGYQTKAGSSGYAQHIVLIWRAPAQALQPPQELPVADHYVINDFCRSANLRVPLGGLFRAGQFDFWFTGVHLKANTGPAACTSAVRNEQTRQLANALQILSLRDKDIVVAGDFNASTRHDSLRALSAFGLRSISDKEHRSIDSNRYSYHSENSKKADSGSQLDHILLLPKATQEWQPASTTLFKPDDAKAFAQRYSDHLPLWADFSTRKDDD